MTAPLARAAHWTAFPERGLVGGVRGLLALVLLLPLVAAPDTVYPYTVGKALYARGLIAVAFALWAVLAVHRPAWRPPRSTLLVLLGLWLAAGVVAAVFGVSPRRSVWSYYERMQGLFDMAHWVAFAVMAAAVLRTPRDWRAMLAFGQVAGLAAAAAAIVRAHVPEWIGAEPLRAGSQVSGTMGNPAFLGAYLQAVALLASGFLVRSLRLGRRRAAASEEPSGRAGLRAWAACGFHAATLAAALWGLALAGSFGAAAGLVGGIAFGALALGVAAASHRARVAALAAVAALALAGAVAGGALAWRAVEGPSGVPPAFDNALLRRLGSGHALTVSAGSRLDNWRAGFDAFLERPLLGWGPDNYLAAAGKHLRADFGRYLPKRGRVNEARDHAHNTVVEEAATKGAVGLAAYLALWGWTLAAALRAARRAPPGERALVVGVGAALAGWFVQGLTWFYFPAAWLVHMLLLAFLVRAGAGTEDPAPAREASPGWRGARLRAAAAAGAVALALGSLAANRGIYAGAAALWRAETGGSGRFMIELEASERAFEPMATHPRILLFENVAPNWAVLRARYPDEAFRLLDRSRRAAAKALAAEPHNWQLHHALAHLYREVAKTEPGYRALAGDFHRSSLEVAPNLDPTLPLRFVRDPAEDSR